MAAASSQSTRRTTAAATTTTTSTCAPETAKGARVFRIEGYNMYKGLGVGRFIQSAPFAVGGYDWRICYYPDGDVESSKDCVSVHLELMTEGADVRALYSLTLIRQATAAGSSAYFMWANPTEPVVFSSAHGTSARGFSRFAKRSVLEASTYIVGDTILISCELTVIRLKEAQAPQPEARFVVRVPFLGLMDDLKNLLETGEEADVSFKVRDEVFHAHKLILAMRSPVFKATLYGPMGDNCGESITIEDMHPVAFRGLLHFIYTDEFPELDDIDDDDDEDEEEDMIQHLLVAADRYGMERMKLMCERIFSECLDSKTVATTLAFADQYNCSQLKDACIGFINSLDTMDPVLSSTGYEHLKRACPNIFVDIWEKAAKARKN
ncbi:BTB/POZ and MATH domain-containing protein 1-like isoform X2 [Brachypodium distachyon]|nr:BTB/POZ and MATH domain-containing protein 1-like isoform X2 [Brachypodium distachyon]|eukprot:XP_024317547.1 BTB/POZ and MATH domain-containing protein 1-like isoform X2 [Brachypodium distachyon]